jgi:hypothetical protein
MDTLRTLDMYRELHLALVRVYDARPQDTGTEYGMCHLVGTYMRYCAPAYGREWLYTLQDLFKEWPHFSGDIAYPVPASNKSNSPLYEYTFTRYPWDQSTEYGRLRLDLLNFCIVKLSERICQIEEKERLAAVYGCGAWESVTRDSPTRKTLFAPIRPFSDKRDFHKKTIQVTGILLARKFYIVGDAISASQEEAHNTGKLSHYTRFVAEFTG